MIRRPPRSTLFPSRRSSDLGPHLVARRLHRPHDAPERLRRHERRGTLDADRRPRRQVPLEPDRKSTRLNSSHSSISYAVFCLKKKKTNKTETPTNLTCSFQR